MFSVSDLWVEVRGVLVLTVVAVSLAVLWACCAALDVVVAIVEAAASGLSRWARALRDWSQRYAS